MLVLGGVLRFGSRSRSSFVGFLFCFVFVTLMPAGVFILSDCRFTMGKSGWYRLFFFLPSSLFFFL